MALIFHITQILSKDEMAKLVSQLTTEDALLLSQDGVYNQTMLPVNLAVYALEQDVQSRSVKTTDSIELVEYAQLGELIARYNASIKY